MNSLRCNYTFKLNTLFDWHNQGCVINLLLNDFNIKFIDINLEFYRNKSIISIKDDDLYK